ncbi:MAG: DUF4339 domain-containing protein, partial [Planctomycetota bacterium]
MVEWYYAKNNERFGPVTSAELKQLAEANQLGPDDLVWREGMSDWVPARRVKGLFPTGTAAETPQGTQATDASATPEGAAAPTESQPVQEVPQFTEAPTEAAAPPSDALAQIAAAAESEPIGTGKTTPPRFAKPAQEASESGATETSTEAVSSEEAVRFTPPREAGARMGAGFERSMSAFTRAREGGGGHLFDALLN